MRMKLPPADYSVDGRLREIGYGQWEGLTLGEMKLNDAATFARRDADKWGVAAPSGESYASVTSDARLAAFPCRRYGDRRSWRHHAGADGSAGPRDAA